MSALRRLGLVCFVSLVAVSFLLGASGRTAVAEDEAQAATSRKPMLWVVDSKPRIYLFGTIHLADPRVLAHPDVVQKAIDASGALYTELPLGEPDMQGMMARLMLPSGEPGLDQLLSKELYDRCNELLESSGTPLALMHRFKPWVVFLRLQTLDVDPQTAATKALDAALYRDAAAAQKTVGGLETMDEQLDLFDGLSMDEQVALLEQTVTQIEEARSAGVRPLEQLLEIYLRGDADGLLRAMYEYADSDDPLQRKLMKTLVEDRNVRMVKRMLATSEADASKTHFVAVGAGHLPGKMGIVALLRKTGYRVKRVETLADIERPFPLARRPGARRNVPATPTSAVTAVRGTRRRLIRIGPFCLPDLRPCCPCPCP